LKILKKIFNTMITLTSLNRILTSPYAELMLLGGFTFSNIIIIFNINISIEIDRPLIKAEIFTFTLNYPFFIYPSYLDLLSTIELKNRLL
jgi:hypothetical protein